MKINVTMTAQIEADHYPLSVLNELLYHAISDLALITEEQDVDLALPVELEISYENYDTGQLQLKVSEDKS